MSQRQGQVDLSTRRVLDAALKLFSTQGFRATSARQIASLSGLSVGNVYHHFGGKEAIFERLIEDYWLRLLDPGLPLNRLFTQADFPHDLEPMAEAIETVVRDNAEFIKLIYIDVIEFEGRHIRAFYAGMAERYREAYGERFEQLKREGAIGDVDPMVAVMVASRWLFHFFTVETCFGVRDHLGMDSREAVKGFIRLMRLGVEPRKEANESPAGRARSTTEFQEPERKSR